MLRHLLWTAAKHVARDPHVQRKAAEAVRRIRPRLDAAAREIHEIARETPPHRAPGIFARKLRERVLKQPP